MMMTTGRRYVFEAAEALSEALAPFVERRLRDAYDQNWPTVAAQQIRGLKFDTERTPVWDLTMLLRAIDRFWMEAFASRLGRADRSIANEWIDIRNRLAHNAPFTRDDTERALDSARRLMAAIGAGDSSRRIGDMRETVLRQKYAQPPPRSPASSPLRRASVVSAKFTQETFDTGLVNVLDEQRAAGESICTVISRDLHRRVVGGSQPHRMPQACSAMWKLWKRQGSDPDRIVHTTPSGRSSTIEIEYLL